jgi:hypothetical protein
VEYRLDAANQVVQFYDDVRLPSGLPNCGGGPDQIFTRIANLTVSHVDAAQAPLGALGTEPFAPPSGNNEDNNVVQVIVQWPNPVEPSSPYTSISEVVLRATPYTNVPNGLDVLSVSPPPAPCT